MSTQRHIDEARSLRRAWPQFVDSESEECWPLDLDIPPPLNNNELEAGGSTILVAPVEQPPDNGGWDDDIVDDLFNYMVSTFEQAMSSQGIDSQSSQIAESPQPRVDISMHSGDTRSSMAPTFECPICMGPLVEQTATRCGHMFCKGCIKLAIAVQAKCPVCRRKVANWDLRRIYFS